MSERWPKAILDPVHKLIVFDGSPLDGLIFDLIKTPEFQRLRRIRQLGFNSFVFPGATHTRFSHSIGVLCTARLILSQLEKSNPSLITPEVKAVLQVSALLHDIGHGPFSHVFESVTNLNHEEWTWKIITDTQLSVNQLLSDYKEVSDLDIKVSEFFIRDAPDPNAQVETRDNVSDSAFSKQVISSQLDADRFDYLIRDSHYCGVNYGLFDLHWLIHHLKIAGDHNILVVGAKGINTAQEYIFARYHMYRSIYYHKTVRACEVMLKNLIKKLRSLGESSRLRKKIEEDSSTIAGLLYGSLSTREFLMLDDSSAWELIKVCSVNGDKISKRLSSGLINRELLKCREINVGSEEDSDDYEREREFEIRLRRFVRNSKMDPEFLVARDVPRDTPYMNCASNYLTVSHQ